MPMSCSLKVQAESSCTERNPIGHRTQPDRTADATRSDTERDTMTQTEAGYTPLIATNAITL